MRILDRIVKRRVFTALVVNFHFIALQEFVKNELKICNLEIVELDLNFFPRFVFYFVYVEGLAFSVVVWDGE